MLASYTSKLLSPQGFTNASTLAVLLPEQPATSMPEGAQPTLYVFLADEVTRGQLQVPLDSFAEFCLRMDQALQHLEARWQHLARPKPIAPLDRARF